MSAEANGSTRPADHLWWAGAAAVVAIAFLLRLPGLRTDLWFDELWSLQTATGAHSWLDLILRTKIDNNHHLNSLYLYALGAGRDPIAYRFLAFASGIAAVVMAWLIGARDSRLEGGVSALLFGTSYLMVFYSTEARGYATVVLMTLVAWYALRRHAERPSTWCAAAFTVASVLGIMAHGTYLLFFIGAFLWYDAHTERTAGSVRAATSRSRRLFAGPAVLIGLFYLVALYRQQIGGGPPYHTAVIVAQALSAMSGGPQEYAGLWIAALAVASACVASLVAAYRARDDRWLLYSSVGVVIPAIVVLASRPPTLSARYFIVPATVLLLALSNWLSQQLAKRGIAAVCASALIAAHVVSGVLHIAGPDSSRGHYREALERMLASSHDELTVSSADLYGGHDFRNKLLVEYYARALGAERRIRYVTAEELEGHSTDWVIVESPERHWEPRFAPSSNESFQAAGTFEAGDLSGISWYLYRNTRVSLSAGRH